MSGGTVTLIATWIFIAVLLIIQPWLTRKNVLFGVVFGSDGIWKNDKAKNIRMGYLAVMIAGSIIVSLLFLAWCLFEKLDLAATIIPYLIGILVLLVYGSVIFVVSHTKAIALKTTQGLDAQLVPNKISIETSLPDSQTVISTAWLLLFLPMLLVTYGVAFLGYPSMPAKIPTHYSYSSVDVLTPKSWPMVLFPLFMGTAIAILLFVCCLFMRRAPASVRGNPQAAPEAFRFRKNMVILLIVLNILTEASFLLIEIGFLTPLPPLLFEFPVILDLAITVVIFIIYFRFVRVKKPKGPILDDDSKWVLGMFYYNPSDPSTFVEKRTGIGYTLNFARPGGWALLIGVLIFIIATTFFSVHG